MKQASYGRRGRRKSMGQKTTNIKQCKSSHGDMIREERLYATAITIKENDPGALRAAFYRHEQTKGDPTTRRRLDRQCSVDRYDGECGMGGKITK